MRVVIKGVYHILSINSCWYFYLERLRKHFLFWRKQCHITQGEGVGERSPNVTRGRGGPKSVKKVSHTIWMAPYHYFWLKMIETCFEIVQLKKLTLGDFSIIFSFKSKFPFTIFLYHWLFTMFQHEISY